MKMVASGRGGWEVPGDSYEWRFQQARDGRGPLIFDDGWHKLSTALWLFGPVKEVRAWIGSTEIVPGIEVDAPTTRGLGTRERRPRRVGRHVGGRHVPAFGLLHQRRALGGHRSTRLRPGESLHRSWDPGAELRDLPRRRDAIVPRAGRRLGEQLPRLGTPLAARRCAPVRVRSCGAPTRRSTSCGSRSPPTRAATRGGVGVDPRSLVSDASR